MLASANLGYLLIGIVALLLEFMLIGTKPWTRARQSSHSSTSRVDGTASPIQILAQVAEKLD